MKCKVNTACIGCGYCVKVCPRVFHTNRRGTVHALEEPIPDGTESAVIQAKEHCPTQAIEMIG